MHLRWHRALIAGTCVGIAVWLALRLRTLGTAAESLLPDCLFRRWTGWQCPGCGMTRATHAVLHGAFGEAFRHNPVGFILVPLAIAGLAPEIIGWIIGRPIRWRLRLGTWGARAVLITILGFWLVRNLV